MISKYAGLVMALFLLASGLVSAQGRQWQDVDSLITEYFDASGYPGLAVAIRMGNSEFAKGYGYADVESRKVIDPARSLFRIGSISKTITSVAMMRLFDKGKLDLDAQVSDYVPRFNANQYPVTVRQVAQHVGGIRHYRDEEFLSNVHYSTVSEGLEIFIHDTLLFEPGERYGYSSYGYNLLSAVVESASGKEFLRYVRKNVFKPLKMKHTFADDVTREFPGRVTFYIPGDSTFRVGPPVDNSYKWAGGGFISTATDLVHLADVAFTYKPLTEAAIDESWTVATLNDGSTTNYGLGWDVNTDDAGRRWVGHAGGSVGGSSMMLIYPELDLVVVTLINQSEARARELAFRIASLILDR